MNKSRIIPVAAAFLIAFSQVAAARNNVECGSQTLRGEYVFSASGYSRVTPDAAWVPKAIIELLQINGDGTLTTPSVTLANPFGNTGAIVDRVGNPGTYSVNDDCTGLLQFADGNAYRIYVAPQGHEFWMIQTVGAGGALNANVIQGRAKRIQ